MLCLDSLLLINSIKENMMTKKDSDYDYEYNYDEYEKDFYGTITENESENDEDTSRDCNGEILKNGDSVQINKDLKIKGMSKTLKRGTIVKGIKISGDEGHVDCKIGKSTVALKTCFLKKI